MFKDFLCFPLGIWISASTSASPVGKVCRKSSRRRTRCLFHQSRFLQSAANVESFLLKRKEIGNYFLFRRKVIYFLFEIPFLL